MNSWSKLLKSKQLNKSENLNLKSSWKIKNWTEKEANYVILLLLFTRKNKLHLGKRVVGGGNDFKNIQPWPCHNMCHGPGSG